MLIRKVHHVAYRCIDAIAEDEVPSVRQRRP